MSGNDISGGEKPNEPLQRLHLLNLRIVRVKDGVHATFGGRGMTPEDLGAMTRAIAAELLGGALDAMWLGLGEQLRASPTLSEAEISQWLAYASTSRQAPTPEQAVPRASAAWPQPPDTEDRSCRAAGRWNRLRLGASRLAASLARALEPAR